MERRRRGHLRRGHHPSLVINVAAGVTTVGTSSEALAEEILARNPGAVRHMSRRERRRIRREEAEAAGEPIPRARVTKAPPEE